MQRLELVQKSVAPVINGRHIGPLDGLRGIAILLVLLAHFYQGAWLDPSYVNLIRVTSRLANAGRYGVELFFVLSGFLITGILLDTKAQPRALVSFYMRRLLRIFPLYYASLAVVLLIVPLVVVLDAPGHTIVREQIWLWSYLSNVPGAAHYWDESEIFKLGHFWSLCVEEHFYMLWPLMVFHMTAPNLVRACLLMIGAGHLSRGLSLALGSDGSSIYEWTTLQRIDGLAVGALIAVLVRDHARGRYLPTGTRYRLGVAVSTVAFLGVLSVPYRVTSAFVQLFGETIVVVLSGLLLLGAIRAREGGRGYALLTLRPLVTLGKYSYGLYVIHGILRPQFARVFDFSGLAASGWSPLWVALYYVPCVAVSCGLAYLSYHTFEFPFLKLKGRFAVGRQLASGS